MNKLSWTKEQISDKVQEVMLINHELTDRAYEIVKKRVRAILPPDLKKQIGDYSIFAYYEEINRDGYNNGSIIEKVSLPFDEEIFVNFGIEFKRTKESIKIGDVIHTSLSDVADTIAYVTIENLFNEDKEEEFLHSRCIIETAEYIQDKFNEAIRNIDKEKKSSRETKVKLYEKLKKELGLE